MKRNPSFRFAASGVALLTTLFLAGCEGGGGGGPEGGDGPGGGGVHVQCGVLPDPNVFACIKHALLPKNPALDTNLTGVVTGIRPPAPEEPCRLDYSYLVSRDQSPDWMIDLTSPEGEPFTVGIAAPGFSESSVAVGETLDIHFAYPWSDGYDNRLLLEIERDGAFVVAVGRNVSGDLTIAEGVSECWNETDCVLENRVMVVTSPGGETAYLATGTSVMLGDLLVTNDIFEHFYPEYTGCDGPAIDYIMSAVPQ